MTIELVLFEVEKEQSRTRHTTLHSWNAVLESTVEQRRHIM